MASRWVLVALLLVLAECQSERAAFSTQAAAPLATSQSVSGATLTFRDTMRSGTQEAILPASIPKRTISRPNQRAQRHSLNTRPLLRTLTKIKVVKQTQSPPASHDGDKVSKTQALFYLLLTLLLFSGGIFLVFLATKSLILAGPGFPGIVTGALVALLGLLVVLLLTCLFILAFWPGKPIVL